MSEDMFDVEFNVSKEDYEKAMSQMPSREQAALIRKAYSCGDEVSYDFPEFIGEKIMALKAGYGILTLTLQAFGAGLRCFRIYAHARMEGCSHSGSYAVANIEPEEFYSKKGFALRLFDCGFDIVNIRFVS